MRFVIPIILALTPLLSGCNQGSNSNTSQSATAVPGPEMEGTMDFSHRGEAMPGAAYLDAKGQSRTLDTLKGQPVLLNLWATWCGPCVIEMPTLDAIAARTSGRLHVVTVSQDVRGLAVVAPWWQAHNLTHIEQLIDAKQDLLAAYNGGHADMGSLPTTVLYDKEGKELWRMTGAMNWSSAHANALIAEVIE